MTHSWHLSYHPLRWLRSYLLSPGGSDSRYLQYSEVTVDGLWLVWPLCDREAALPPALLSAVPLSPASLSLAIST